MSITGYGEDALCYWALSCRLHDIVDHGALNPVVIYRPSFGRRGSTPGRSSSQFGEFDAIVATTTTVFLVEAKWRGSAEIRKGEIKLRDEQTRRHRIFRAYLEAWWGYPGEENWEDFSARTGQRLTVDGSDYLLPEARRKLATNLKAVLDRVGKQPKSIEDVLLYLVLAGETNVPTKATEGFRLVTLSTVSPDGFVELPVIG